MRKGIAILAAIVLIWAVLPAASGATSLAATRTYTTSADFDEGILVGVEHETVPDQLQLSRSVTTLPFIWVPNNNGTVSKVDTTTGNELGRYFATKPGLPEDGSPSRTTVDLQGNVWVGNRTAGTVVKIGLLEAGQCVDRNRNGTIETSRDRNGDGNISTFPTAEILPWGTDECVLFEVVLVPGQEGPYVPGTYTGPYDTNYWGVSPRSLAIDANNNLWAGTGTSQKFYYIDGDTGEIRDVIDLAPWGHQSYGATIDRNGILWSLRPLLRIDPSALGTGTTALRTAGAATQASVREADQYASTPGAVSAPHYAPVKAEAKVTGTGQAQKPLFHPGQPATPASNRGTLGKGSRSVGDVGPTKQQAQALAATATPGEVRVFASFSTNYTYRSPGDSVGNIQAGLRAEVKADLHHPADGSGQSVLDPILDLNSPYPLEQFNSSGNPVSPPAGINYRWSFPALPEDRGEWAGALTDQTATVTTGMSLSRAADQRRFTGPGPFTQTVTVTVRPEEAMDFLWVWGRADVDGLNATVTSVSGGNYNRHPDGRGFDAWIDQPAVGQEYTWQVTIAIGSLPASFQTLDYMPEIQAGAFTRVAQGESVGSSLSEHSVNQTGEPLATWNWQSAGNYHWNWQQEVRKLTDLMGFVKDPFAPEVQIDAGVETLYNHFTMADAVDNSPVQMGAGTNTNLHHRNDGSGQVMVDPIVDLSSAYTFEYTDASGHPLPPPPGINYRWGFPSLPEGQGVWARGETDRKATLAPGFTASREVDRRDFTGPGTQKLTVRVTPAEPMDRLQVFGWVGVNELPATIRSADGEQINIHPDGRGFDAWVNAPAVGQTYVWEITIEIPAPPAGFQALSFMPDIQVRNVKTIAAGISDGSSLTRPTEFATWAWQATGNYRWHWHQDLGRQVHLGGSISDPLAPDVQVDAAFETAYSFDVPGDTVDNNMVKMHAGLRTNLWLGHSSSGQPLVDPILDLSSSYPIERADSNGQTLPPPAGINYRWGFPSLSEGPGAYANAGLEQSVELAPGFTASRQADQRRFTGPGTQKLTVRVTPTEAMDRLQVDGRIDMNGIDAVVSSVAGPNSNPHPDGRGFNGWIDHPAVGQPLEWEVTITIRSLPAGFRALDFMPQVWVRNVHPAADGVTDGDRLTGLSPGQNSETMGVWTWQATGTYRWQWRQVWQKEVRMAGDASDPLAPIREVRLDAGTYALAPDYLGHLFVTGYEQNQLSKLDTATGAVIFVKSTPPGCARGVAVTLDNHVWVADTCRNSVLRYDNDGNLLAEITGLSSPSGVAVDAAGKVWATDMGSENIHRIDPATNKIDLSKTLFETRGHYSYSDMTGMVSRTISTTTGTWTVVHDGGQAGTPWGTLGWTSKEPDGTAIAIRVRSSEDQSSWSAWETVQNGVPLVQTPKGRYIQVEATFRIVSGDASPVLYDLTVRPAQIAVSVDIKPTSCPNPLNPGDKGALPAAILGTAEFDVSRVAPETVRLAGVAPVRWELEDVATPCSSAIADPPDRMNCTTAGKDGFTDLSLKFDAQAISGALGSVSDGDVLVLQVTGQLKDGTPFVGQDVVWIVSKKNQKP
ncbi:MAG TPA: hypothetical protein VNT75_03805 [Symbiobacteriaceae bacterium]|nr:hypothetical protein [Symbiobacteriaceae bacterium]